jgi:hypothetical protein
MKKKRCRENSGMSLVESTIVIGTLAIFSIFLVSLTAVSRNAWEMGNASIMARSDAKLGMEAIAKELRAADPDSAIGVTLNPNPALGNGICFAVPSAVAQGQINVWTRVIFQFDAANNQILRMQGAANCADVCSPANNCSAIARNVQSLTFAQAGNAINTTVTTARPTPSGRILLSTLTSSFVMRN